MELATRNIADVVVLDVRGKLVGGYNISIEFSELINSLLAQGERRIIVNLGETPWASTMGIGMLIGALGKVEKAGGDLVLACVPERIRHILDVTRLFVIFRAFSSDGEALRFLNGAVAHPRRAKGHVPRITMRGRAIAF